MQRCQSSRPRGRAPHRPRLAITENNDGESPTSNHKDILIIHTDRYLRTECPQIRAHNSGHIRADRVREYLTRSVKTGHGGSERVSGPPSGPRLPYGGRSAVGEKIPDCRYHDGAARAWMSPHVCAHRRVQPVRMYREEQGRGRMGRRGAVFAG